MSAKPITYVDMIFGDIDDLGENWLPANINPLTMFSPAAMVTQVVAPTLVPDMKKMAMYGGAAVLGLILLVVIIKRRG